MLLNMYLFHWVIVWGNCLALPAPMHKYISLETLSFLYFSVFKNQIFKERACFESEETDVLALLEQFWKTRTAFTIWIHFGTIFRGHIRALETGKCYTMQKINKRIEKDLCISSPRYRKTSRQTPSKPQLSIGATQLEQFGSFTF